jgi:hypothetical protein
MIPSLDDSEIADAIRFRAAVAEALRGLSADVLRRLATSWPAENDRADRIVAEAIAEALEELRTGREPARQQPPPWLASQDQIMHARVAA